MQCTAARFGERTTLGWGNSLNCMSSPLGGGEIGLFLLVLKEAWGNKMTSKSARTF